MCFRTPGEVFLSFLGVNKLIILSACLSKEANTRCLKRGVFVADRGARSPQDPGVEGGVFRSDEWERLNVKTLVLQKKS